MTERVLDVENLATVFPTDDGLVKAVQGVTFHVDAGEVLAVVGESGSGKSVTALSIMGLNPKSAITTGRAEFQGKNLIEMEQKDLRHIRGKDIAMIFQDPMTALNPVFTVGAQISEAIRCHDKSVGKTEGYARAAELLDMVGIPESRQRVKSFPHEFSGGMRQRAMIAMAIANKPRLLIADEPTTALDVTIQAQVLDVMKDVQEATGAALLLITHDLGLVAGVADRVQVMYAGRIYESGETFEVFERMKNPYTRGLMASIPRLDTRVHERLSPIPGSPPSLIHPPKGCSFRPRCEFAQDRCQRELPQLREVEPGHSSRCHYAEELPPLARYSERV